MFVRACSLIGWPGWHVDRRKVECAQSFKSICRNKYIAGRNTSIFLALPVIAANSTSLPALSESLRRVITATSQVTDISFSQGMSERPSERRRPAGSLVEGYRLTTRLCRYGRFGNHVSPLCQEGNYTRGRQFLSSPRQRHQDSGGTHTNWHPTVIQWQFWWHGCRYEDHMKTRHVTNHHRAPQIALLAKQDWDHRWNHSHIVSDTDMTVSIRLFTWRWSG